MSEVSDKLMLVICEEGQYKHLRMAFVQFVDMIVERSGEDLFTVMKTRDEETVYVTMRYLDSLVSSSNYRNVVFVVELDSTKPLQVFSIKYEDLDKEKPVSEWYRVRRGMLLGKKFGI